MLERLSLTQSGRGRTDPMNLSSSATWNDVAPELQVKHVSSLHKTRLPKPLQNFQR